MTAKRLFADETSQLVEALSLILLGSYAPMD